MNRKLRSLKASEHDALLDLWAEVWTEDSRSYFEHYFTADQEFRDED